MNDLIFKPLFDFFGLGYPGAYMTLLFFSFLLSFPLMFLLCKRLGLTLWKLLLLPVAAIPAALIFSKVFHILFEGELPKYIEGLKANGAGYIFTKMLNPFAAGHVFYGGLFGGFLAGAILTWYSYHRDRRSFLATADFAAIATINGLWITRIGCFLEGCCFGRPSKLFGMRFPQGSKTMFMLYKFDPDHTSLFTDTQPIIPTQLIHSFCNFVIFVILMKIAFSKKDHAPGYISALFLILYPITRFLIEFLRFDQRGSFLCFSTSQWISIGLLIVGIFLWKKVRKGKAKTQAE